MSVINDVRRIAQQRALSTVSLVESGAYNRLTQRSGTPSRPGEYPSKQTGQLAGSIESAIQTDGNGITMTVEVTAPHAKYLSDRKMMTDVVEELRTQIDRIWR